jgi:hypothetical protein
VHRYTAYCPLVWSELQSALILVGGPLAVLVPDSEPLRVAAQEQIAASRQGERFGDGSSRTPHDASRRVR